MSTSGLASLSLWCAVFFVFLAEVFEAAGVVPIAHKSGGPLMDIIIPTNRSNTGYLARTVDEYAEALRKVFKDSRKAEKIRSAARQSALERFSDERFEHEFLAAIQQLRMFKEMPQNRDT